MVRAITPALEALLRSWYQGAASGFRCRVEIDYVIPGSTVVGSPIDVNQAYGTVTDGGGTRTWANPSLANDGSNATEAVVASTVVGSGTHTSILRTDLAAARLVTTITVLRTIGSASDDGDPGTPQWSADGSTGWTTPAMTSVHDVPSGTWTHTLTAPVSARYWRLLATNVVASGLAYLNYKRCARWSIMAASVEVIPATYGTLTLRPSRVSIDKSLEMPAADCTVEIPNENLALGWGSTSEILTNSRIRVYQWYGAEANAVLTFTGLIDEVLDDRDPLTATIVARDMMALLLEETFSTIAPQDAADVAADRTPANGVYLDMEISDIVGDLLDQAGWPSADRAITPTSYVLEEFIRADGSSAAETIIGQDQLTGLVGYHAWADEDGVFRFEPMATAQSLTDPAAIGYTYIVGDPGVTALTSAHVTRLQDSRNQGSLRTRVKVRGPLTTLKDAWAEQWRTSKFSLPVGIWYDPADSANIRVLDRGTKRLYKLRQSDRTVLSSVYLGSVIPYPLGVSGDPADSTIYWVLNAPWRFTGATSGNSVKKVRKADNFVLASYALPNGRWSAIKVSAAAMWLTNLDTDRFYKRSKVDASAVADYNHTVSAVAQLNPSGIMVDGTTLHVFWFNSGNTARFLVCDEATPGTVDRIIRTAGVNLVGGEMDTTTHTECWGGSDSQGLVAKFTLVEPVEEDVAVEVIDSDLEDELGDLAQTEARVHDAHSGDPAHAFQVRRETIDLRVITSLAQATETALRWLERLAQRDRAVDWGIVGNPALQLGDPIRTVDPRTGLDVTSILNTYRTEMSDTYVGTIAVVPTVDLSDNPTDEGAAT